MVRPAGPAAAFLAVAAFASLPGVLAMAGLATTDMGFCAMYLVFILRLRAWLDEPDRRNVLTLGLSIGAVTATKFWSLLLVPVAFLAFGAAHEWDRRRSAPRTDAWLGRLRTLPAAALAAALSLWAIYAFSWGRIGDFPRWVLDLPILGPHAGPLNAAASRLFAQTPVPAPGFWHGLLMLLAHNRAGHAAYALGIESQTGFWYFFPLALLIKTPLPFLILCVLGATIAMWKPRAAPWWVIGAFASIPLVLTALMFSRVNTGLRNVLVIYGLAAIGTAGALGTMAIRLGERERKALATAVAVLGLWQGVITVRSWPDWMTYFNPIAADDPGAYLVDADFDWGQGVTQLEAYFRDHPLPDGEPLWIAYFGSADLRRFALPPLRALPPRTHVSGWIAISERRYRETRSYGWLRDAVPVATVARVIRIYRIP